MLRVLSAYGSYGHYDSRNNGADQTRNKLAHKRLKGQKVYYNRACDEQDLLRGTALFSRGRVIFSSIVIRQRGKQR